MMIVPVNFKRAQSQVTKVFGNLKLQSGNQGLTKELEEAADRLHLNFYEICLITDNNFRIERGL
jgi:hypothetical protein